MLHSPIQLYELNYTSYPNYKKKISKIEPIPISGYFPFGFEIFQKKAYSPFNENGSFSPEKSFAFVVECFVLYMFQNPSI
mmetsp:Transcript_6683/g.8331  ORF Transcript_6683/g.8331 Transcript_6683/m.8331 type:complete len:80 (-) Transcript_6683:1843-2082(-)